MVGNVDVAMVAIFLLVRVPLPEIRSAVAAFLVASFFFLCPHTASPESYGLRTV